MIIGVDHGNAQIKTAHCVFNSSLSDYESNPGIGEILEYNGKFYSVGTKRIPVKIDKTVDDDFYILTLIAIAKELMERSRNGEKFSLDETIIVELSMGLPPGYYNKDRAEAFNQYFLKNKYVHFVYDDQPFNIEIRDAFTFIQCFAAMAAPRKMKKGEKLEDNYLIVDIGGYTVDYLKVIDSQAQPDTLHSFESGIIPLFNDIKSTIKNKTMMQLTDDNIYAIFDHQKTFLSDDLRTSILNMRDRHEINMINEVSEASHTDLKTTPVYFVGGGVKWFKEGLSQKLPNAKFIDDVHANAKGYEAIYKAFH